MQKRYHIIRLITKDQLGGTYLAEDKKLKRDVAFKHFDSRHGSEPALNWENAFTQFATKLQALQHPNLIAILDFDIDDDMPVIITPFIEAETIYDCLQREALSVTDTVKMALDLLAGLQVAHTGGIYHAAMHTGSVKRLALSNGEYQYLITDLGWKHLSFIVIGEENHLEDHLLIPPEIFGQPDAANVQSDLFMIGQLCYTALAGGHPFFGYTPEQSAKAYQAGEMPLLAIYADHIPPALTDWISSMIMSDPKRRPASAQEAINSLLAIDFSEAPFIEPSPPPEATNGKSVVAEKMTQKGQKKPLKIAVFLMLLVSTAIGFALWSNTMQGEKNRPSADNTPTGSSEITLLPTKIVNTLDNRKKPEIIDFDSPDTLDWLITTGADAANKHISKEGGFILNLQPLQDIREFKFTYNPIRFIADGKRVIPRSATDNKRYAKVGQGWQVNLRIPKNHRGPVIITFYMTQWNCDISFEVTNHHTKNTKTLNVPFDLNGVAKIPVQIPPSRPGTFINIKVCIASIHDEKEFAMGLNGIQVTQP